MNLIIVGESAGTFKTAINKRRDDINIVTYAGTDTFAQALTSREIACDRLILSEDAIADMGAPADAVSGKLATFKELLETHYVGLQIVLLLKSEVYLQSCTDVLYDTDAYAVFYVGSSMTIPFLVHTACMEMQELRSTYDSFLYHEAVTQESKAYEVLTDEIVGNETADYATAGYAENVFVPTDLEFENGEGYTTGFDEVAEYDTACESTVTYNESFVSDMTNAYDETEAEQVVGVFDYNTDEFDFDTAVHEYVGTDIAEDVLPSVDEDFGDMGALQVENNDFDDLTIDTQDVCTVAETFEDDTNIIETLPAKPIATTKPTMYAQPIDEKPMDVAPAKPKTTKIPKVASIQTETNVTTGILKQNAKATQGIEGKKRGKPRIGSNAEETTETTVVQNAVSYKYSQIVQGKTNAIIVVTGDRRAGLTTTAMSIAEHFANSVPALYVDFDTQYRGSLCYLSISELSCSSNIVQNGLGVLKPGRNVKTVAFRSDAQVPFDSIVSLPNYALTDEQLKQAQLQLFYQHEYNVVVIDCPFTNLYLLEDVLGQATVYVCVTSDIANSSSTLLVLDALNPNAETTLNITKPLSEKGAAMLSRAQYLITGNDTKAFSGHMDYLDSLYGLSSNDINWAKLPVAGATQNLTGVLQQMA